MRRPDRPLFAITLLALLAGCASGSGSVERSGSASSARTEEQDSAALQVKLGQGYLAQGELETARDRLRRALELDPRSVDAHTVMAVLHERINRPAIAERYYRRAYELKPEDGAVNNNYGTFLCGSGRYDEAQKHFETALADPFYRTPELAYANAGFCALRSGDPVRGEAMLRSTISLQPDHRGALFELARISHEKGDMLRARAFLQRYESISEPDPQALDLGARIEQQIGDRAAAARYRDALQEQFPEFTPTHGIDGSGSQ
jgi:type IV pilus assembly protein PilF